MAIHCEEKNGDLIDDHLIVSIEESGGAGRSIKEAFDRLQISSSSALPASNGVRFGNVSIRQYPVIVGDNPGGNSGPPLSIGWEFFDEVTLDVIEYEQERPPRRKGREMLVPVDVRVARLRNAGYSRAEIVALTKPVNVARSQRKRTLDTLHLQPLFQLNEKFSRKTFSLLTGGRQKKTEKKLLAHRPESAILNSVGALAPMKKTPAEGPPTDKSSQSLNLGIVDSEDSC